MVPYLRWFLWILERNTTPCRLKYSEPSFFVGPQFLPGVIVFIVQDQVGLTSFPIDGVNYDFYPFHNNSRKVARNRTRTARFRILCVCLLKRKQYGSTSLLFHYHTLLFIETHLLLLLPFQAVYSSLHVMGLYYMWWVCKVWMSWVSFAKKWSACYGYHYGFED